MPVNKISLLPLLLVAVFQAFSQANHYEPLKSQGPLPDDLTTAPSQKYQQVVHETTKAGTIFATAKESFLQESTYLFDNLLRSGHVLYNDPLGEYVNEVLQVIVGQHPTLSAKQPRVYILKSTEVNAFAVDQGIIFVSLGLLAKLENEAQLAFILSHELVHIIQEHSFDGFIVASRIDQEAIEEDFSDGKSPEMATMLKNSYSRDQEIEADRSGANYFLQTNYTYDGLAKVFDILRYGHMPYAEIAFEFSSLEKGGVTLPANLRIEEVAAISLPEENEEESTHPALTKRAEKLRDRLREEKRRGRVKYIVSEERFTYCQKRAQMELPLLHLSQQELPHAIYTAHLLEKTYGESVYTQEVIGKALYGIAKFKNNNKWYGLPILRWNKVEGEAQQVFHLIDKLSDQELTILALTYNYDLYRQQPENKALRELLIDLFAELYLHHDVRSMDFFMATGSVPPPLAAIAVEEEQKGKTKHDTQWQFFVFAAMLDDNVLQELAREGFTYGAERVAEIAFYDKETRQGRRNSTRARNRRKSRGLSLGINKAIVLNPTYIQMKRMDKDDPQVNYQLSDERRDLTIDVLLSSAQLLDIDLQLLDANQLRSNDAVVLNDITVAKRWVSTQFTAEGFLYHAYDKAAIDQLADKYETPFLLNLVIVSGETGRRNRLFGRNSESLIVVVVFDLRDGRRNIIKSKILGSAMNKANLQSELYDALFQLSKTR